MKLEKLKDISLNKADEQDATQKQEINIILEQYSIIITLCK